MKTIYESENGKQFETEQEAKEADKQYLAEQKKNEASKAEREQAAAKVTDAFKAAAKAKREAVKELDKFTEKYGSYHKTFYGDEAEDFFESPVDAFFNRFINW